MEPQSNAQVLENIRIQDQNMNIQIKHNARREAIEHAKWINRNACSISVDDLTNEADKIYKWLTQDVTN